MNELIKIETNEKQEPIISGRILHEFLEVKTRYNDWIKRMLEYGFVENVDYMPITQKRVTAQGNDTEFTDHVLKLDMAKEISMIQRNEKGKQARQYFIEVEKEFNSPEKIMARALKIADETINKLTIKIEEDKPKVLFAEAVETAHTTILVGELAKLIKQNGVEVGQNKLFEWLRNNGYLIKRQATDYNMPTQKSMEMGLFEIKENTIINKDGSTRITKTPKVTGKGQTYFVNIFLSKDLVI